MQIAYSPEQQAFKEKINTYMAELMTPELVEELSQEEYLEGGGPLFKKAMQKMGEDGWISHSWPTELGGGGATAIEQFIFTEAIMTSGFPYPFLTVDTIGPMLAQNANGYIKETVVKEVLKGNLIIAVGYSEPNAGTDLASLKTTAKREGDEWVINGQKIWTSLGQFADYVWLAARTNFDPELKKHKAITIFMVPTTDPGFSYTAIQTMGMRTNASYYEDIRLDDKYRVGEIDAGWGLITGQLNRERLSIVNPGMLGGLVEKVADWAARTQDKNGQPIISTPWVKENLARVFTELETLKLTCWKQAWVMQNGNPDMADSSAAKVYGSEFFVETYRRLLEIMGQAGTLAKGSEGAILKGKLEHRYRVGSVLTFGGGTNEIQREIIAGAGLWLPRAKK